MEFVRRRIARASGPYSNELPLVPSVTLEHPRLGFDVITFKPCCSLTQAKVHPQAGQADLGMFLNFQLNRTL
jgi:hypothetical protein